MTTSVSASSFQNSSYVSGSATTAALTTSGRITASDLYNQDYLEDKYKYKETAESYEEKDTAQDEALDTAMSNFIYQLEAGYEDKAMEAYEELLTVMSEQTQYSTLSESELKAVAKSMLNEKIEEDTDGEYTKIQDYITDNAADADKNYMQKVLWRDSKVDSTTQEDLLEEVCGVEVDDTVSGWTYVKGFFANLFTLGGATELFDFAKHH